MSMASTDKIIADVYFLGVISMSAGAACCRHRMLQVRHVTGAACCRRCMLQDMFKSVNFHREYQR